MEGSRWKKVTKSARRRRQGEDVKASGALGLKRGTKGKAERC